MGFWATLLKGLRIGAAVAESQGVKVKGVPIGRIRDVAEREGGHIADAVKAEKAKRPPKPRAVRNSSGD